MRRPTWLALLLCVAATVLSSCAAPVTSGDALLIRGELGYRERIALPPDSAAVVELSRPHDGRVIAEQQIPLGGRQVPIPFELRVQRSALGADTAYALRGAVHIRGRPEWISDPVDVRVARGQIDVGTLLLRPWEAVALAARFQCGPRTAHVGFVRDGKREVARMTIDNERFELNQAISGSGARYEAAGDPTTTLWVKGERATITVRGQTLPECRVERDAPDAVRARGNEPSWRLDLGRELVFATPDERFEGTAPPAQTINGVRTHVGTVSGRSIRVALTPRVCRDTMSGMPYPWTAEVIVSGRMYRGCAGDPEALLVGGEWIVESIDGRMIDRSRATLDFGIDGRLAGKATCNAYTAAYTLTGESLTVGNTATTRMNCPPALMEQEQLFLDVLQRVRTFDVSDTGALILQDDRGRKITARRGG
jgi:heat shock protein HslJ/uncharacterized lipoprotein YbaY